MYDTNDIAESLDSTWIVSGQSPVQKDMIRFLPKTKALYVEGAFRVWLREAQGGVLFDGHLGFRVAFRVNVSTGELQRCSSTRSLCFGAHFCSSCDGLLGQ